MIGEANAFKYIWINGGLTRKSTIFACITQKHRTSTSALGCMYIPPTQNLKISAIVTKTNTFAMLR